MAKNPAVKNLGSTYKKGSYSHESSPLYTNKTKKETTNNCFQPADLDTHLKLSSREGLKKNITKPTAANMFIGNLSMRINAAQASQKKTPEPLSSSITQRKNSKHYFGVNPPEDATLSEFRHTKAQSKDRTPQTSFDETRHMHLVNGTSYEFRKNPLALVPRHNSEAGASLTKNNLPKFNVSNLQSSLALRAPPQGDPKSTFKKPNGRNQKSFDVNSGSLSKYTPYLLNVTAKPPSTANNSPRNIDSKEKKAKPAQNTANSRGFSQGAGIGSKPMKGSLEKNSTLLKGPSKSPVVMSKHRKTPSYDLRRLGESIAQNTLTPPMLDKMRKSADFGDNRQASFELMGNNKNSIRFAIRTRAGVAPNGTRKINQDSFIFHQGYGKKSDRHLLGVCDGHGMNGHFVSGFVKETLPAYLLADPDFDSNIGLAFTNAFEYCLQKLLVCDFDCKFSGTTAAFLLMDGKKIITANAGDSRAVMGSFDKGWSYTPLTMDHKPDHPQEAQRIIRAGGRIEAFKDLDGNPVGPSRVWLLNQDIPGLAMSRSIGDLVAASVGVSYIPEIKEFELSSSDRFLIIASDGVWEFIENSEVVQIVASFYEKNDIEGACDYLLALSLKRWQEEEEVVVDDITLMIAFF